MAALAMVVLLVVLVCLVHLRKKQIKGQLLFRSLGVTQEANPRQEDHHLGHH